MSSYYEKILATGEVKCIDEEIPFEIPQGWEWCRIRNISQSYIGLTYSPSEVSPQGTIVLRSSNIQDGKIVLDDIVRVTKNISEKLLVEKNDIIICARNGSAKLVGKSAIVTEITEPMTFGAFMAICKTSLYQYVSIFLQSDLFFSQLRDVSGTTTINQLTQSNFNGFLIAIPPLEEQHRIFEKINDVLPIVEIYGNKQEQLNKLNDNLRENVKKSILQEAIQGKLVPQIAEEGSAQELLEQIKAEKQKLVKEGKLKKSALNDSVIFRGDDNKYWEKSTECMECIDDKIPFEIPSTWCWVRHNQLFEISGGSQPPKSQFVDNPKSGYIRLYQIRDYGSNPMPVYIPKEKANKITKEGDILLARYGGSLGKVFWAKDGAYNVAMAKVIPLFDSEFVNKQYLFLFYQSSIYQYLVKDHSRSAQAGFNKDDLTDLFFPLPPLEEQSRIVEKYKSVTSIINR